MEARVDEIDVEVGGSWLKPSVTASRFRTDKGLVSAILEFN